MSAALAQYPAETVDGGTVYVVERVDFDNGKSLSVEAITREIQGFTFTRLAAEDWVADEIGDGLLERYEGWDEETYPKFVITEARILR